MQTKTCVRCKQEKAISEFGKYSARKDGLDYWCKACRLEYKRSRKNEALTTGTKQCRKCLQELPVEQFHRSVTCLDGLYTWCKSCYSQYAREKRKDPEGYAEQQEAKREATRVRQRDAMNRWRKNHPEEARKRQRAWVLQRTYGIDLATYHRMVAEREGKCDLCGRKPAGRKALHVDHEHDETGRVRGLLCTRCNTALGVLGDTEESLKRVIAYTRRTLKDGHEPLPFIA
jgi:hypothetical protein